MEPKKDASDYISDASVLITYFLFNNWFILPILAFLLIVV